MNAAHPAAETARDIAATPPAQPTELRLDGLRRELNLRLRAGCITASLNLPRSRDRRMLVYAGMEIARCRLAKDCLWIGHAAFDLATNEVEKVRATFEPHGLLVEDRP